MEPETKIKDNNEPVESTKESTPTAEAPATDKAEETKTDTKPSGGVSEYKTFAILGYILPFLFFLPLLDEKTKNVPFVRFHANQQLIVLLLWLACSVLDNVLYSIMMFVAMSLMNIVYLAIFVLAVMGAINAYKEEMKELPFIGHFRILK